MDPHKQTLEIKSRLKKDSKKRGLRDWRVDYEMPFIFFIIAQSVIKENRFQSYVEMDRTFWLFQIFTDDSADTSIWFFGLSICL